MEDINSTLPPANEVTDNSASFSSINQSSRLNNSSEIESELEILYSGVGLRDISNLGFIELRGNDVMNFLHRISTNSIENISKGETVKTIFCTEKGRIIDTAVVINLDEFQLIVTSQEHHEKIMIWLQKYIVADDVTLNNINGKYTLLEVLGPEADSFMVLINGNVVNNLMPNSIKILNNEGIIYFLMKHYDHNGNIIYWILADPNYAQKLIRYMIENRGPFDFNLIGEEAYENYRIENGIPFAPNEINDMHNPHELGLMNLVSTTKGCYIGQEVIARLETYDKVQKYFCGFVFSEPVEKDQKFVLFDDAKVEVGNIKSATYSFRFKKYIGLGFVKRNYFDDRVSLNAKSGDNKFVRVQVIKLPFKK